MTTTWRKEFEDFEGFDWKDVEASTLTEEQLDKKFNNNYGSTNGCCFTVWTKDRIYFPACYDGAEWIESVARNPDGKETCHVGGG